VCMIVRAMTMMIGVIVVMNVLVGYRLPAP
jgi:hypothetical protein